MQLPQVPEAYDAKAMKRILVALSQEIIELRNQLAIKEAKSLNNEAIGSLQKDRFYLVKDTNRINIDLAIKHDGRLHTWSSNTEGSVASTGGQAPADAQYVVSAADAGLPNADVLTATANQTTVSNGVVGTVQDIATTSTPQFARLGLGQAADANLALAATRGALIDGSSDEIQLRVQGHSTQTNALLVLEDSAGNDQVTVSNDGAVVINEEGNAAGDLRAEGDNEGNLLFVDASDDAAYIGGSATGKIGFHKSTGAVAQSTGWAVTNVTPDKTFDANSTSIDELADVLGTLITFLLSRGDLGA